MTKAVMLHDITAENPFISRPFPKEFSVEIFYIGIGFFLLVFRLSPLSIIHPINHTHSFINHRQRTIPAISSVVKQCLTQFRMAHSRIKVPTVKSITPCSFPPQGCQMIWYSSSFPKGDKNAASRKNISS
jgi:hypothetical protein